MKRLIELSLSNPCGEIDCDVNIEVQGVQWHAYTAHVGHREILLYCDKGTASLVVDTYGDRATCELVDWSENEVANEVD